MPIKAEDRVKLVNGNLFIDEVIPEDSGMYQCNASNIHGYKLASTSLQVSGIASP